MAAFAFVTLPAITARASSISRTSSFSPASPLRVSSFAPVRSTPLLVRTPSSAPSISLRPVSPIVIQANVSSDVRPAFAEFLGTAFLVMAIHLAVATNPATAAFVIPTALAIDIYAFGHASGGNLNPAVSLGLMLQGAISQSKALIYMAAQCLGGVLGAAIGNYLIPYKFVLAPAAKATLPQVFLAEVIFTWFLVTMAINSGKSNSPVKNLVGILIGAVVAVAASVIGGISGACLNPAVAVGFAVFGMNFNKLLIYALSTMTGGFLAHLTANLWK